MTLSTTENMSGRRQVTLSIRFDRDENLWLGMMYQASIVRFDQKTETFRVWSIPKEWDSEGAQFGHLAVQVARSRVLRELGGLADLRGEGSRHAAEVAREEAGHRMALGVVQHLEQHAQLDAVGMRLDLAR